MKGAIMELVTVIITTHNRSDKLKNAIRSVLNQTYVNIEIIVVDDYSSDDTELTIKEFISKYNNIKYYRLDKPSGANVARNIGIMNANGIYITGLDDDDVMLENRIINFINNYDDKFAFICSQCYYQMTHEYKKIKKIKSYISLNDMLYYNHVGNQVFSKKQNFIDAGNFDENILAAQDYDMWIRMLISKPIALCIKEPTMIIDQINTNNRITTSKNKFKGYFQVYKKYKYLYSSTQRKAQLLRLRNIQKKNYSFRYLLKLLTLSDYKISIVSILRFCNISR